MLESCQGARGIKDGDESGVQGAEGGVAELPEAFLYR